MKKILVLLSMCVSVSAFAQTPLMEGGMSHPHNPAFEAAIQSCKSSVPLGANGHPDHQAFDNCMTSKGFQKPAGGPPHGQPPQGQ